ncbi:hypothetical protein [Amycolatopsis echigonensis]|nr:hypothetical protein [Amycolatopsis echigonensis]
MPFERVNGMHALRRASTPLDARESIVAVAAYRACPSYPRGAA